MRNKLREGIKKPSFILALILLVFFLKGVFLATVYPMFTGQDEARHYNTIQYLVQPSGLNLPLNDRYAKTNNDNFSDYNFSQEILQVGQASGIDRLRSDIFNTINFSSGYNGRNEAAIDSNGWKPYNYFSYRDIALPGLYHQLGAAIEKAFANQNILVRFYSIRIFSVLLGTLAILFAYLIAENVGFPAEYALLLTAIVAFQPKLSDYFTNINYDALLIPMFFLFTLGGVLALKNGLNWKNFSVMLLAAVAATLTKGTGLILCGTLALFILYF
ncbi:MAG: glycosyltransferase family 39 protein, partial [Candidatus Pacebacteria bacterium]|nr:glycosyltransferase family 39 protein [Candidatus Paceibacterota bacterium]